MLRLVHDGRLPALRVSQRIYRIPAAAFERYKAGGIEQPLTTSLGPIRPRPRFGEDERLPDASDERTAVLTAGYAMATGAEPVSIAKVLLLAGIVGCVVGLRLIE